MSLASLKARLRRVEAQKAAQGTAPPTESEIADYAHGRPVRQHVQHLLDQFAAYGVELREATQGICQWPQA